MLAVGKETPCNELCDIFNNETDNGADMNMYNKLLKTAISEINRVFKKRASIRMTNSRDAQLMPTQTNLENSDEPFELITWLVIR